MADTAVAITAGAGTLIDTRTESTNSNHRQVVVLGDPSVNAGVAPVDVTTGLVVNPMPAVDKGSGTGGTLTQRVIVDSSQLSALGQATMAASAPVVIASNQTTLPVGLVPVTTGGLTVSSTLIAAGTNATSVKASAGQLYKIEVTNNSANIGYLKLYNTAGTPTAGSGTPVIRLMCPGNASGAGAFSSFDNGVTFGTGIGFTFTGGIADADTTSVAASAFIVNLYYK